VKRVTTPSRSDIIAAAARISGYIRRTPVLSLGRGHGLGDFDLVLKLDLLQPTGTFKVRGAYNRLLAASGAERVVAASGGNFARAVAHAARRLGMTADLFVPDTSPKEKIDALFASGAKVHVIPGFYPQALAASRRFVDEMGGLFAHAYDDFEMVAGAGTCGMEIAVQVPQAETVLVAVGGGGLVGGIASWFRGDVSVVGVETHGTASMAAAFKAGAPVEFDLSGVAVSSLGSSPIGEIPWEAASQWVEKMVQVSDEAVVEAQRWLWENVRLVAEPGAAVTIAALLAGAYLPQPEETVVALICGANTDPSSVLPSPPASVPA
jgi:threonine dehydratase